MRLVLGGNDMVLSTGEAAEFDTRVPHAFGNATARPPGSTTTSIIA